MHYNGSCFRINQTHQKIVIYCNTCTIIFVARPNLTCFRPVCSCTGLFVGPYCQWKNPCHTGPVPRCQNSGTCAVTQVSPHSQPGFSCQCPLGFTASLCEIPISNACDSKPCQNGGTCWLHNIKEHRCNCAPGFTGMHNITL